MRVLFVASEIYPYAKSGGLADVADAFVDAASELVDISRIMPLYGFLDIKNLQKVDSFEIQLSSISYDITIYKTTDTKVSTYFIDAPMLGSTKNLYGEDGVDYTNNDLRFGIFCMAVVEFALRTGIDILHLNDWHSALAALYVKERQLDIKTIFTIHNLAYQGIFDFDSLGRIGVSGKHFHMDALEFYGKVNFLKAGIAFCDVVTTVSKNYAKEILTKEFGCGLDGFLRLHRDKLSGILNGINTDIFNPKTDRYISVGFDENTLADKYKNKTAFIKESTLKDPRRPLFVMIARLVEQKGIDLIIKTSCKMLKEKINLFIVGEGDEKFSNQLKELSKKYNNFEFFKGYDEGLSHRVYASADFLLMPSKFEPCGLNQMIAMRYATIPIVHSVGGLKESVFESNDGCGFGIVFKKYSAKEFENAFKRALALKKDKQKFEKIKKANMQCDFSFKSSALEYVEIYKKII